MFCDGCELLLGGRLRGAGVTGYSIRHDDLGPTGLPMVPFCN